MKNLKEDFQANLLDGEDINDCGNAMLNAKHVLEYFTEYLSRQEEVLDFLIESHAHDLEELKKELIYLASREQGINALEIARVFKKHD